MAPPLGMTWYDVLGVLPTARHEAIQRCYEAKCRQLGPGQIAGAPSKVIAAAGRARAALDAAWRVLGDPIERERYDEQAGIRRPGSGLERQAAVPSEPRVEGLSGARGGYAGMRAGAVLGVLAELAGWLAPHPRPSRRVIVPDVQGLFVGPCLHAVGRAGLRIETVRLTEHPMPVEGLVVDQSPAPGTTARRSSTLTVRVWHPPVPMSPRPTYA
jgi:hypothetical protein